MISPALSFVCAGTAFRNRGNASGSTGLRRSAQSFSARSMYGRIDGWYSVKTFSPSRFPSHCPHPHPQQAQALRSRTAARGGRFCVSPRPSPRRRRGAWTRCRAARRRATGTAAPCPAAAGGRRRPRPAAASRTPPPAPAAGRRRTRCGGTAWAVWARRAWPRRGAAPSSPRRTRGSRGWA